MGDRRDSSILDQIYFSVRNDDMMNPLPGANQLKQQLNGTSYFNQGDGGFTNHVEIGLVFDKDNSQLAVALSNSMYTYYGSKYFGVGGQKADPNELPNYGVTNLSFSAIEKEVFSKKGDWKISRVEGLSGNIGLVDNTYSNKLQTWWHNLTDVPYTLDWSQNPGNTGFNAEASYMTGLELSKRTRSKDTHIDLNINANATLGARYEGAGAEIGVYYGNGENRQNIQPRPNSSVADLSHGNKSGDFFVKATYRIDYTIDDNYNISTKAGYSKEQVLAVKKQSITEDNGYTQINNAGIEKDIVIGTRYLTNSAPTYTHRQLNHQLSIYAGAQIGKVMFGLGISGQTNPVKDYSVNSTLKDELTEAGKKLGFQDVELNRGVSNLPLPKIGLSGQATIKLTF